MAQATTVILLPQTSFTGINSIVGTPRPAAAYYLGNQDLQTLSWTLTSFSGLIIVQASLAETQTEDDWFVVFTLPCSDTTSTSFSNLLGNFVHLRVKVNNFNKGTIQNIKVSY